MEMTVCQNRARGSPRTEILENDGEEWGGGEGDETKKWYDFLKCILSYILRIGMTVKNTFSLWNFHTAGELISRKYWGEKKNTYLLYCSKWITYCFSVIIRLRSLSNQLFSSEVLLESLKIRDTSFFKPCHTASKSLAIQLWTKGLSTMQILTLSKP